MAQAKASASKSAKSKKSNAKKAASTRTASAKKSISPKKNVSSYDYSQQFYDQTYSSSSRYFAGIIFLILSICTFISYFKNEGSFVVFFSDLIKGLVGWGFWAAGICFFLMFITLCFGKSKNIISRSICLFLLPILFAACIGVISFSPYSGKFDFQYETNRLFVNGQNLNSAGVIGGLIVLGLGQLLTKYGAAAVLIIMLFVCVFKALGANASTLAQITANNYQQPSYSPAEINRRKKSAVIPEIETVPSEGRNEYYSAQMGVRKGQKKVVPAEQAYAQRHPFVADVSLWDEDEPLPAGAMGTGKVYNSASESASKKRAVNRNNYYETNSVDYSDSPEEAPAYGNRDFAAVQQKAAKQSGRSSQKRTVKAQSTAINPTDNVKPVSIKDAAEIAGIVLDDEELEKQPKNASKSSTMKQENLKSRGVSTSIDKISREDVAREVKAVEKAVSVQNSSSHEDYEYPPVNLLRPGTSAGAGARDEIIANKERLEIALHSFGVNSNIVEITCGPTVTRYDIELEQGVKLSRITNLAGDLALSLGVVNVRIAPIPDKISTVGIEVPNKIVSTVSLRDIIDTENFRTARSKLSFAIGKDISGTPIIGNIAKLPHMLIAGTTGSGKSVCMNSIILSLLYKAGPDEVKFIMVDPKMVELGVYNSIPHLYVPVVTDPKKAAGALQWAVVEMLKRYSLFSESAVRDLDTFNKHRLENGEPALPKVVIVIDELADLMMAASKEVEESICRIAQMGRAAGMHLIIATQRPSADVITGLMKANIPSRIAFAVSSALESRIILDQGGAEKLIGMGDMLYSPVGVGKPQRIQGAFVSDDEREDIIDFIKDHSAATAEKNDEIEQYMKNASEGKNGASSGAGTSNNSAAEEEGLSGDYDEKIGDAAEVVLEMKSCSVSMLQRRLKLGYSRAARVVDQLEELGVVGPYEGAKPRSLIVDRNGWNEIAISIGLKKADDFANAAILSDAAEADTTDEYPFVEDADLD